jgi:hypothetical protein
VPEVVQPAVGAALLQHGVRQVGQEGPERDEQRHERGRSREEHGDEDDLGRDDDVLADLEDAAVRERVEPDADGEQEWVEPFA